MSKKQYMNPEVKAKWVEALRSGKYEQTSGALIDKGGHCCLGVLCDVYAKERKKKAFDEYGTFLLGGKEHREVGTNEFLPEKVMKWAGFIDQTIHSQGDMEFSIKTKNHKQLHVMNDDGYTFEDIANVIEREL